MAVKTINTALFVVVLTLGTGCAPLALISSPPEATPAPQNKNSARDAKITTKAPPAASREKEPLEEVVFERPPIPAPALFIPGRPGETAPAALPKISSSPVETIALPLPSEQISTQVVAFGPLVPVAAQNSQPPQAPPTQVQQAQQVQVSPVRYLYEQASRQYAGVHTYMMRLKRREVVHGQAKPEEILLCKIRRNPQSVYFKWLGGEGQNREVVYVKGQHDNKIHTLTAAGDIPLVLAGRHIKISPDSIMVKARSRYPITEAGIGSLIDRYGRLVFNNEKGDTSEGALKYLGKVNRPEFAGPIDAVLQTMPPGADPLFPRGGQRFWFFDPQLHFPVLVISLDENGREAEYYCHDRFLLNVKLDDDDFTPTKLWKNATP